MDARVMIFLSLSLEFENEEAGVGKKRGWARPLLLAASLVTKSTETPPKALVDFLQVLGAWHFALGFKNEMVSKQNQDLPFLQGQGYSCWQTHGALSRQANAFASRQTEISRCNHSGARTSTFLMQIIRSHFESLVYFLLSEVQVPICY
jgi:hypothetical protein